MNKIILCIWKCIYNVWADKENDVCIWISPSLKKQPPFCNSTTGFHLKWHLRNKRRNSILITHHYPDLSSTSDWLKQISHTAWPTGSTTQIWLLTHHHYVIFCARFSDFILAGKPLMASRNVRCFFRLDFSKLCLLTISCRLNPRPNNANEQGPTGQGKPSEYQRSSFSK